MNPKAVELETELEQDLEASISESGLTVLLHGYAILYRALPGIYP